MPKYNYKAKQGPVNIKDGVIEAQNLDGAINKIIQMGLSPIDVEQVDQSKKKDKKKAGKQTAGIFKKVRLAEVVHFTRQMSDLVDAAVPILRSLQTISNQTSNVQLKKKIEEMHIYVRDGGSFSDALAQHADIFSPLYINMVRTGEVSGKLEGVLNRLADYLEKELEMRKKVISSLAYPSMILIVGFVTVFVLMAFVIPRISIMFDDLNQALPLPTIIIMNISGFFARYWWLMIIFIGIVITYVKYWLGTPKGRLWFDKFKLKIPLLGKFIRIVEVGRFARTLGTLVESEVAITTALNSVWATLDNLVLRNDIKRVSEQVANGQSLRASLEKSSFFPEMAVNMIAIGEETGRLERGLYKIANTYEREADETIKTLVSLLGPIVLSNLPSPTN